MEPQSAKDNIESKKQEVKSQNRDIRSFFQKVDGPVVLTTNRRIMEVIKPYINEMEDQNYKLRKRKIVNYKAKFEPSESEKEDQDQSNSVIDSNENFLSIQEESHESMNNKKRRRDAKSSKVSKKHKKSKINQTDDIHEDENSSDFSNVEENDSDFDYIELRGLKNYNKIKLDTKSIINDAEAEVKKLVKEFYVNEQNISTQKSNYPSRCIPISADIRSFKFLNLADKQMELTGKLFDVIMMDPPWQLSSSQPTRGVAIAYDTLNDSIIETIPVERLQTDGFIFIWTINAKFKITLDLLKQWGYKYFFLIKIF